MTRNGTPPWPGDDDLEHEGCTHDSLADFAALMALGAHVEMTCADCERRVRVHGNRLTFDVAHGAVVDSVRTWQHGKDVA